MPATPPVGNGLATVVENVAASPLANACWNWLNEGLSFWFQVIAEISRASNLLKLRSTSAPAMAGIHGEGADGVGAVGAAAGELRQQVADTRPGCSGLPPTVPCSSAMAMASLRRKRARRLGDGSSGVAGSGPSGTDRHPGHGDDRGRC